MLKSILILQLKTNNFNSTLHFQQLRRLAILRPARHSFVTGIDTTYRWQCISTAYAMTAMAVATNAGHVIELTDGAHYGTRVVLLHRLPRRGHQGLD